MPELCRFFGIVIRMFAADHPPPHFHAEYSGGKAKFAVADCTMIEGEFSPRARRLVREWWQEHVDELADAWARTERGEQPPKIDPLR